MLPIAIPKEAPAIPAAQHPSRLDLVHESKRSEVYRQVKEEPIEGRNLWCTEWNQEIYALIIGILPKFMSLKFPLVHENRGVCNKPQNNNW